MECERWSTKDGCGISFIFNANRVSPRFTTPPFPADSSKWWTVLFLRPRNLCNMNVSDLWSLELKRHQIPPYPKSDSKPRKLCKNFAYKINTMPKSQSNSNDLGTISVDVQLGVDDDYENMVMPLIPFMYESQPLSSRALVNVRIQIHHVEDPKGQPPREIRSPKHHPFTKYLSELFGTDKLTDVIFLVKGEIIPIHRLVLSAHSPVFEAMFTCDMVERKTGVVAIEDLEPMAMKVMLRFMYTNEEPQITSVQLAIEVYRAAHMYAVDTLTSLCRQFVEHGLDDTNALDVLLWADQYSEDKMKEAALHIILKSPKTTSSPCPEKCKAVILSSPRLFQFVLQNHKEAQRPIIQERLATSRMSF